MTDLKVAELRATAEQLKRFAIRFVAETEPLFSWHEPAYRFPDVPSFESVRETLLSAIDWHVACEECCAYGTLPMIDETCFWIALSGLTSNQIYELCILLNRLHHEALGKWG